MCVYCPRDEGHFVIRCSVVALATIRLHEPHEIQGSLLYCQSLAVLYYQCEQWFTVESFGLYIRIYFILSVASCCIKVKLALREILNLKALNFKVLPKRLDLFICSD